MILFLFASPPVEAVTTTVTDVPSSISSDSFTVTVSISGASSGTNYLRIDLYKESTTNYFGETYNNASWYSESDHTQYFPVSIQSGTDWTGSVQGRMGSPTSTEYDGSGTYKLRVRRYTSSGNYTASEANNNAVTIAINVPTPTSTPTRTPTPTKTPTPTPTPIQSGSTPTKTPTPTQKLLTPTPTKKVTPTQKDSTNVLGESTTITVKPKKTPTVSVALASNKQESTNYLPKIFIGLGTGIILVSCAILGFQWYKEKNGNPL